jgi:hypothetical protein
VKDKMDFLRRWAKKLVGESFSTVVQTTNTLAKQYLFLKKSFPQATDKELYTKIIEARYKVLPIADWKMELLQEYIQYEANFKDFVSDVLHAETDYLEHIRTDPDFVDEVESVIDRELEKYSGLP